MKLSSVIAWCAMALTTLNASADELVILHTNDTHSQIDPADNGLGGVARRKAAIDSLRALNKNVLLIDAGDAVQGTMYFTIYKGEVEYALFDSLHYDVAILGNHDFDNGVKALERNLRNSRVQWISSNYDFSGAPVLDSIFTPALIKSYGNKKVGVMGINLVPEGMIAKGNYDGVTYRDAYTAANETASKLRQAGADYVVAVTHIGYDGNVQPTDVDLAATTQGIDLIIGSHSHSLIDPANATGGRFHWKHTNAAGDTVAVVQTGSRGANLGVTRLDLENGAIDYSLVTIDSTFDNRLDPALIASIDRYRSTVDSIMHLVVGSTARELGKEDAGLMNFLGDFIAFRGEELSGAPVDMSIINSGGVRRQLPAGEITQGMLIDMLPFNNRVVVLDIAGADLMEAVNGVVARGGFDGVKENVKIVFDPDTKKYVSATLNGVEISPDRTYRLATIDYLANGGDYMTSLPRATEIARSGNVLYDDLIEYVATQWSGKAIDANPIRRILPIKQ